MSRVNRISNEIHVEFNLLYSILVNLACGDEETCRRLVDAGIGRCILPHLAHVDPKMRRVVVILLYNFASSTTCKHVITEPIMRTVGQLYLVEPMALTRQEAEDLLKHLLDEGTETQQAWVNAFLKPTISLFSGDVKMEAAFEITNLKTELAVQIESNAKFAQKLEDERQVCCICMQAPRCCLLLPCRHMCCCDVFNKTTGVKVPIVSDTDYVFYSRVSIEDHSRLFYYWT